MVSMIVVVIVLMILNVVVSYKFSSSSRIIIKKSIKLNAIPNTEDDSSELDFESSSSIKEKKQKLRQMEIEQENNIKALQKASRDLLVKIEKENSSKPSQNAITIPTPAPISTPISKPVVISSPSSSSSSSEGMSSSESKAFDAGLLIAFPVIVATLGFFFFFPFLRENLASSLPPLPTVEEMMRN